MAVNKLDTAGVLDLATFVRDRWDDIVAERWTRSRAAEVASVTLGRSIVGSNVASVVAAMGRDWPNGRKARAAAKAAGITVADLAGAVADLYIRAGVPVPAILHPYIARAVQRDLPIDQ